MTNNLGTHLNSSHYPPSYQSCANFYTQLQIIEIDPHSLQCSLVEMASHQLVQQTPTILPSSLTTTMPASVMAIGDHSPLVAGTKRPIMSDTL